jgi:riboflavin synthase
VFTGIVQGLAEIVDIKPATGLHTLQVRFPADAVSGVTIGASVALSGTCLTVVHQQDRTLHFDVMMETLARTTLGELAPGDQVNFERAARIGDEIGGHLLSGHIHTKARLQSLETPANNRRLTFEVDPQWMKYIFPKGYIAIDGASLTVGETTAESFTVYLIPETLRVTRFGHLVEGDTVNLEVDSQTQTIVDTLARLGYGSQNTA